MSSNKVVLMREPEEIEVPASAELPTIGQLSFWTAVSMAVAGYFGLFRWLEETPSGRLWGMMYVVLGLVCAFKALSDIGEYLREAVRARREKQEFEAMGLSAAVEWARRKEIHDALTLPLDRVNPRWMTVYQRTGQAHPLWNPQEHWKIN
jgi:hypothetical protein